MFRIISKLKNKKGFTLIELIVVLAVLAIIMAIAVPRFLGVQKSAKVDSDEAILASIAKLAELEYVRNNNVAVTDITNLVKNNFNEYSTGNLFQSETVSNTAKIEATYDNGYVKTIKVEGLNGGAAISRGADGRFNLD